MADKSYKVEAVLTAVDRGFSRAFEGAKKSVLGLQGMAKSTGSVFKSVLGANLVGAGISKAIGAVSGGIREMSSELVSSSKAWQTFEGNMRVLGKGKEEIDAAKAAMQDYATKTIYSASDMASTYAQLAAVGVKNTGELVQGFGNLAAASENPTQAMKTLSQQATQMAAKPKVQWQDFKLMLEQTPAGIAQVARAMGKTTEQLIKDVQDGKVATQDFFDAIVEGGKGFEDMATKFKTIDQAVDGLKENMSNQLMPVFEVLNDVGIKAIEGIINKIGKLDLKPFAESLKTGIPAAVRSAQKALRYLFDSKTVSYFSGAVRSAQSAVNALVKAFSAESGATGWLIVAKNIIQTVGAGLQTAAQFANRFIRAFGETSAIHDVKTAINGITKEIQVVFGFIQNSGIAQRLGETFGRMVSSISKAISKLVQNVNWEGLLTGAARVAETLMNIWSAVYPAIASVITAIANIIAGIGESRSFQLLTDAATGLVKVISEVVQGVSSLFNSFGGGSVDAIVAIAGVAAVLAQAFGPGGLIGTLGLVKGKFGEFTSKIPLIGKLFKKSTDEAGESASKGGSKIAQIFKGLGTAIKSALQGGGALFKGFGDGLGKTLTGLGKVIESFGKGFGAMLKGIGQGLRGIPLSTMLGLVAVILAVGAAFALAGSQGAGLAKILQGLGQGIGSVITALGSAISNIAQGIGSAIATIITAVAGVAPALVPLVTAVASGMATVITAIGGVAPQLAVLVSAIGSAVSGVINAISGLVSAITPIVQIIGTTITTVVTTISDAIVQIVQAIAPFVPVIAQAFTEIVRIIADAIVQIVQAIAPFIPAITEMVVQLAPLISQIIDAFNNLVNTLGPIISQIIDAFTNLVNQIGPILDSVAGIITAAGGAIKSALEGIGKVFESVGKSIATAAEGIGKGVQSVFDGLSGVIDSVGGVIKSFFDGLAKVFDSIGNAALNAGKGFDKLADGVVKIVNTNLGDLVASLGSVSSNVGKIAGHAGNLTKVGDGFQKLVTGFQQVGQFGTMAGTALALIMTSLPGVTSGFQQLQPAITAITPQMQPMAMALMLITPAMTQLAGAIMPLGAGFTQLGGVLPAVASSITALQGPLGAIPAQFEAVKASITGFGSGLTQVSTAFQQLGAATSAGMTAMASAVTTGMATVQAAMLSGITLLAGAVQAGFTQVTTAVTASMAQVQASISAGMASVTSQVQGAMTNVASVMASSMAQVNATVSSAGNQMAATFTSMGQKVVQISQQMGQQLSQNLQNGMNQAKQAVQSGMSQIVSIVNSARGQAHSAGHGVGAQISAGIAQGMWSNVGSIEAAASRIIAAAERAAAAAAKIKSPSRLFANKIGRFIPAGVAMGIDKNMGTVEDSMSSMFDTVDDYAVNNPLDFLFGGSSEVTHKVDNRQPNQPLQVVLELGGRAYNAFVEDISRAQNQQNRIRLKTSSI